MTSRTLEKDGHIFFHLLNRPSPLTQETLRERSPPHHDCTTTQLLHQRRELPSTLPHPHYHPAKLIQATFEREGFTLPRLHQYPAKLIQETLEREGSTLAYPHHHSGTRPLGLHLQYLRWWWERRWRWGLDMVLAEAMMSSRNTGSRPSLGLVVSALTLCLQVGLHHHLHASITLPLHISLDTLIWK